jgi:hypothetical protein
MRDRSATRALVLGLLGLPFGVFAPFAIWSGTRSLLRIRASHGELRGATSAAMGLAAGLISLAFMIAGASYWFVASR